MARAKKVKEEAQDLPSVPTQKEKTLPENKGQMNKSLDKPLTNIELYAQQVIQEINQADLAEKFEKSVKLHGTKKITIRIDRDVLDFYERQALDCTTAMKKALRIVMDAVKEKSIKF